MTLDSQVPAVQKRKVGIGLGIGIFFLPLIFAWFTLRQGHSTLARILSFGWMGLGLLFWIGTLASPTPATAPSVKTEASTASAASSKAGEVPTKASPPAPRSKWSYSQDTDEMRGDTTKHASLQSENEVRFEFPYNGGSTASIMLRRRNQDGLQIMIGVDKGQFMCNSFSGTSINAKFDDGAVQSFSCTDTSSGEADTIFLTNPQRFLTALKSSEKVIIEAEFYQYGPAQFTFETAGLEFQ